ncbi:MAG: YbeD family protein [Acidiferrobacter sp.]
MAATNGQDHHAPEILTFPCKIDIKAFGLQSPRFEALVHQLVSEHIEPQDLLASSRRESRGGKYVAVTLTIQAVSRAQLDTIYRALSGCPDVLIAL